MNKFTMTFAAAGAMTLAACVPPPELSVDDVDLARYASAMAQVGCVDFDGITHAEIRNITGWKDMKLDKVEEEAIAQLQAIDQPGVGIRSTVGACANA